MTNVVLPTFTALASGAVFVKGFANNGSGAAAAQYVTFGHCFQIGQLPAGSGLSANFGAGAVPCQVDVKTTYADGSAARAVVTVQAPGGTGTAWGQFSPSTASAAAPLGLLAALGGTALSVSLTPTAFPDWTANEVVTEGAIITPKNGNAGAFSYICTQAGTTGSTEPTWVQAISDVQYSSASNYTITDGTAIWATFGQNLTAPVTQDLVALVTGAAFDPWLNGQLAVQGRAWVALWQGLRVQVDLTAYADGTVAAVVMLADDIAMLADAGSVAYSAEITLSGTQAYASGPLVHFQYQNWKWRGGTVPGGVQVIHDPADFIAAQAVMPYDLTLGVDPSVITNLEAIGTIAPLQPGPVDQGMSGTGGRPDIGFNAGWTVPWFLTQNAAAQTAALEVADVAGAIPWHYFNATTGTWLTTNDYPALWTQPGVPSGAVCLTQLYANGSGWTLDTSHNPDLSYLPALMTGERAMADEVTAAFAWHVGALWPAAEARNNGSGYFQGEQVRCVAWCFRDGFYSAYIAPDGSAEKAYAEQILASNFTLFNGSTASWATTEGAPAGWCPNWYYGVTLAPWQQDFLFGSVSLGAMMGFPGALEFCQWMGGYIVGRFEQSANGFPPADGIAYNLQIFPAGSQWGSGTPYQTWAEIETATQAAGGSNVNSSGTVTWAAAQGYYGQLGEISLVNATILDMVGAEDALAWLEGAGAPYTDPTSWATSSELYGTATRTLNASEVFGAMSGGSPSISSVALSNSTFPYGAPAGTVVGVVSVTMSDGSEFAGTLSLTGTDAADFALSGNNLVTVGALAAGSYSVSVVATQSNAANSPFTQAETITGEAESMDITGIALSASSFKFRAPVGTVVGAVSVQATGGTFTGTLSLGGTNAADFALSGGNLVTVGDLLPGTYAITVTATESGATGSPFTQSFSILGDMISAPAFDSAVTAVQVDLADAQTQLSGVSTALAKVSSDLAAVLASM